MKQQFVITSRYTTLQGTENTSAVINRACYIIATIYKQTICLCTQHFDRQCVCNANMLDDFVGYDKSPSHERDYEHGSDHRSL